MNEPLTTLTHWEPEPDVLYTLDRVAQFAGLPRRHIVLYARHGLIAPAVTPPDEGWYFTAEAIHPLRRIANLQERHRLDLHSVRLVLGLMWEIERLREELLSSRGS
jgi:DNA-binding transcriptional MerR regulator